MSVLLSDEDRALIAAGTHYQCEVCGGVFGLAWSDADALEESRELFGPLPPEELAVICDGCFERGRARGILHSVVVS